MKILRDGDLRRLQKYKKFVCDECGCMYIAGLTEYCDMSNQYDGVLFFTTCPCCGKKVYNYSVRYVDENGEDI